MDLVANWKPFASWRKHRFVAPGGAAYAGYADKHTFNLETSQKGGISYIDSLALAPSPRTDLNCR